MTCPATVRIGGFLGMTLACKREPGHKGAHEPTIPSDIPIAGTPGKWIVRMRL